MSRRNFAAPAWCMYGLGVFAACLSAYTWYLSMGHLSFFYMPAIIFIEASMYWLVRKRNIYQRDSWWHVLLFAAAYSTTLLRAILFSRMTMMDWRMYLRLISLSQFVLFWGMMIMAHILFIRLFVRIFSKQPDVQHDADKNILDDVT